VKVEREPLKKLSQRFGKTFLAESTVKEMPAREKLEPRQGPRPPGNEGRQGR
jgi:hypothetical protein